MERLADNHLRMTRGDKVWISNINANTWKPGEYGWSEERY